jgi:AcrR family transcriptional regulator
MKHSLVRKNIINTASNLFYQKGYNLTGINEIIKETGIAKATLYNHFKSKDDICIAYLKNINSSFLKDIKEYTLEKPKGKKQLLALFDFLKAFFYDKEFNGCWCINTVSEIPRDNSSIRNEIQNQKNLFLELITDLVLNNYAKKSTKEANVLAKQVYLMYESAVSESHLHLNVWPIDIAKKICSKILD